MKLTIIVCAIILGTFATGNAVTSNCNGCKNFLELSGHQDETMCASVCADSSEQSFDSSEVTLIQLGCNGCLSLASQITSGIHQFSFRNIILAVTHSCTHSIPNCHAFVAANEDELIDAIYHYKRNPRSICHAIHQC